jgi:hypothetical protein
MKYTNLNTLSKKLFILFLLIFSSTTLSFSSDNRDNNIYEQYSPTILEDIEIPNQLFDITFTIDSTRITNIGELTGLVTYTSFGQVPTPVNYTFELKNKLSGEIISSYSGDITVQTEMFEIVYFEQFNNLKLSNGDYIITYNSVYNHDVADEFIQEFSIDNTSSSDFEPIWGVAGVVGILIIGGSIFFFRK